MGDHRRRGRVLAPCAALAAALAVCSPATAKDLNRPLILVHGHKASSNVNCDRTFKELMAHYRWWGYKGSFHPVRYYTGDTTCRDYFGAGSSPLIIRGTSSTRIETVARSLAWYVYNEFNRHGRAVNVVAHSMGGLIVRYAIDQVQRRRSGWPPAIVAPSVVTFGTPHNGIEMGPSFAGCRFSGDSPQCRQMDKSSSLIEYLRDHARNPQGGYGTWWSVAGAHDDDTVDEKSAVDMSVKYKIRWAADQGIEHSVDDRHPTDYMHAKLGGGFTADARCWSTATGASYGTMREGRCYWPLQWSYVVLTQYGY